MPLTIQITDRCSLGNLTEHRGTIQFGAYAVGGIPYVASDFGFSTLKYLDFPSAYYDDVLTDPMLVVGGRGKIALFRVSGQELADGTLLGSLKLPFSARGLV